MKLKNIQRLSRERIINMKGLYEEAGISVSSMNSRLSTLTGKISLEEQNAIELALCQQIEQIVDTLEIDRLSVANTLGITTHTNQKSIEPVGYLEASGGTIAIFIPADKVWLRKPKSGVKMQEFWNEDKVVKSFISNQNFIRTDRGTKLFVE